MLVDEEYLRRTSSQAFPRNVTGLHLGPYFGLEVSGQALLMNRPIPDLKESFDRTPLSWATENGHEAVVKLLLETGRVDVNSKDQDGVMPLSYAAWGGYETVIKLLLKTPDIDVDSKATGKDNDGQTPLSWAAWRGH